MQDASESLRRSVRAWLTCRPLKKYGFALSKLEFRYGLCLRYCWTPARIPSHCSCGQEADVTHSLSCPLGGYPSTTAALLNNVCHDVSTKSVLQPLTGENLRPQSSITEDYTHLDVALSDLWGSRFERTFIDVRIFNSHARSNRPAPRTNVYQQHEQEKAKV